MPRIRVQSQQLRCCCYCCYHALLCVGNPIYHFLFRISQILSSLKLFWLLEPNPPVDFQFGLAFIYVTAAAVLSLFFVFSFFLVHWFFALDLVAGCSAENLFFAFRAINWIYVRHIARTKNWTFEKFPIRMIEVIIHVFFSLVVAVSRLAFFTI